MKKLLFVFLACSALGLASCSKCVECTGTNCLDEICKDDYGSKALYDAVVKGQETNGCKCK